MAKKADALDLLKPDYEQVGRHRARKTAKERLIGVLWMVVAWAILSTGGYYGLNFAVSAISSPEPTKIIVKGIDISIPITVIDGTGTRKYAASIGQELLDANYVVPYSRTLDTRLTQTEIRIKSKDYTALAKRLQVVLGKLPIVFKADAKYPIEVRLGTDYSPKG